MFKLILIILISLVLVPFVLPATYDGINIFAEVVTIIISSFNFIARVIANSFNGAFDFYYVKAILYLGIFIFLIKELYVLLTNNTLSYVEDDSEYQEQIKIAQDDVSEKKEKYYRNINDKEAKQNYYTAKADLELTKSSKYKNYLKNIDKIKYKRKWQRRKKK